MKEMDIQGERRQVSLGAGWDQGVSKEKEEKS